MSSSRERVIARECRGLRKSHPQPLPPLPTQWFTFSNSASSNFKLGFSLKVPIRAFLTRDAISCVPRSKEHTITISYAIPLPLFLSLSSRKFLLFVRPEIDIFPRNPDLSDRGESRVTSPFNLGPVRRAIRNCLCRDPPECSFESARNCPVHGARRCHLLHRFPARFLVCTRIRMHVRVCVRTVAIRVTACPNHNFSLNSR